MKQVSWYSMRTGEEMSSLLYVLDLPFTGRIDGIQFRDEMG